MISVLQEHRAPPQCPDRSSIPGQCRRKTPPWSCSRPDESSTKMGRRQPQRKSLQQQYTLPSQENTNEKKLPPRRKQKPRSTSTKRVPPQPHSAQETTKSRPAPSSDPAPPAGDRLEHKVQPETPRCSSREHKHTGSRGNRHTPAVPCHQPGPDLQETPNPEVRGQSDLGEGDSDTDLSESERLPASPPARVPPKLQLRPEFVEDEDVGSQKPRRDRGRSHAAAAAAAAAAFPDFLPPPFNSWSLGQLAVFYNTEGRGAPRPRPVGPLERFLDRLLQLEWLQIQTLQEEGGGKPDVTSGCHRSSSLTTAAASSSRLSSPKCILQCQRSFPLSFLSSLAGHSALLSGCACTSCRIRYSTCGATACCRSAHRQSRPSPTTLDAGPRTKRSYSESRVHASVRSSSSPVRTSSHLRRMQASGNLRNPVPGATTQARSDPRAEELDYRNAGVRTRRRRSGSEQRRGQHGALEKRRSGSECWRRAELNQQEIKPDAVAAIMDNLPKSSPINRPGRQKQVDFVT